MKILLIGKNGQLGQEIYKVVKKEKATIVAYGRENLDITDYKKVAEILNRQKPTVVINTSAVHATVDCEQYPEKLFLVNSFAIHNLATICRDKNIQFINYSTDYVFDGLKGSPYVENDRQNPLQMYGLSKYTGEIIALNYNPRSIVIRTCGVYSGQYGSRVKGNFVLNMLKEAKMGKNELEVSSEQIVSPTYAYDLAKATWELIKKNPEGGIYHLVNEGFCSWAEFTQEIMRYKKIDIIVKPVDRKGISGGLKRPLFSALKNKRAASYEVKLPNWKNALHRYLDLLT